MIAQKNTTNFKSKTIYLLIAIFFMFGTFYKNVSAESFEIISDWMDVFFENGRNPWGAAKTELSYLNTTLKDFVCQNDITKDGLYRMACTSKKGALTGMYQIIFNFGDKNQLKLDAVEIIAYHPELRHTYEQYGTIDLILKNFKSSLRRKDYTSNNQAEYEIEKYVHTFMTPNVIIVDSFRISGSGITLGRIDDKVVLNIASDNYYNKHHYYWDRDEKTGEKIKVFVNQD